MRQFLSFAVKLVLSVALLYFAFSKVDLSLLLSKFDSNSVGWILASIVIYLLQLYTTSVRWRDISGSCDAPMTQKQAIRFTLIGSFFNQTLPSSIGGDAVRLLLLSRSGAGWRAAVYSVLADRAVGLIGLALVVVVSLPWSYQLIADPHGRVALVVIDLAALCGCAAFLAFGTMHWRHKGWSLLNHLHSCSVITGNVLFRDPMRLRIWLLSLAGQLLTTLIFWTAARSIGSSVGIVNLLLITPPVLLITLLPISIAGWGLRESAMTTAFGYAGLALNEGLNLSLIFGLVSFLVGAIGGLVLIADKQSRRHSPAERMTQ